MNRFYTLFLKGEVRRLPAYGGVYALPLLLYLQIGQYIKGMSLARFWEMSGCRAFIIWTCLMLAVYVIFLVLRLGSFSRDLSRISSAEREELLSAAASNKGFRLFDGQLFVTAAALWYTGGVIIPLEEVSSIVIERSDTTYLPVYHMYVYFTGDMGRRLVRIGFKPLSYDFESALPSHIKVTRQDRPLFGKGSFRGGVKR